MSQVPMLKCPICNPEAGDFPVRRVVNVTSEELVNLIQHVVMTHMSTIAHKADLDDLGEIFNPTFEKQGDGDGI